MRITARAKYLGGAALGSIAARELWRWRRRLDLRDRVVLVTGGSRGFGLALARELAAHGARLAICGRDEAQLAEAARELAAAGAQVMSEHCDVAERDQVEALVTRVLERYGRVDVLVNNAGVMSVGPLASLTTEDFTEAMGVMFWGVLYPTLAVLPHMRAQGGGRIANVTSIGGKVSIPHLLPYAAAKFAAVGLSEGLRSELLQERILVTTVVPGLMRTGSYLNAWFKGDSDAEVSWFALSAATPVLAMSARRAARRVVRAIRHGDAELILTPQARLLAAAVGLAPGLVADTLGLVNRALPRGTSRTRRKGAESGSRMAGSALTARGRAAASEYLQHPER